MRVRTFTWKDSIELISVGGGDCSGEESGGDGEGGEGEATVRGGRRERGSSGGRVRNASARGSSLFSTDDEGWSFLLFFVLIWDGASGGGVRGEGEDEAAGSIEGFG
jgi:hypothetical protein